MARPVPTVAVAAVLAAIAVAGVAALVAFDRIALPPVAEGRLPAVAYDAYRAAAAAAPAVADGCAVDWTVVAGIAQVESRHGTTSGARVAPSGEVLPPIRGAPLNGQGGTRAVADTDGGVLDDDATWDRAVGPLQFIPMRWRELGRDGNGDGVADPDNVYDAAFTAVAHLCILSPGDYSDGGDLRRALLTYNRSGRYADEVLRWIALYRSESLAELIESPEPAPPG